MAFTPSVNNRPTTGPIAMFEILTNFLAAGWTCKASGDGLSAYSSTGSVFSNGGASGANGLANNYAWFRIQDPGAGREFVVERGTTNLNWGIKYSLSAHFTTGGSSTTVPTATDEVPVLGNITGTGGSGGTYVQLWGSDNSYVLHMMMGDSTIQYAFWILAVVTPAQTLNASSGGWMMDYVTGVDTGDLDPTVHYAASISDLFGNAMNAFPVAHCYFTAITSGNFGTVELVTWFGNGSSAAFGEIAAPQGCNYWNGYEDCLPAAYTSTTNGWKGWSTLFTWYGSNAHNTTDLANIGNPPVQGTKNYMVTTAVLVPWPAGTNSIV